MFSNLMPASAADSLFSRFQPNSWVGRFFEFPISRLLLVALFLLPWVAVNALLVYQLIERLEEPLATQVDIVRMLVMAPLLIIIYRFYCQVVEKRDASEVGLRYLLKESGLGALVALLWVCALVAMIALSGGYHVSEVGSPWLLGRSLILFGVGALFQELILLGVIYRLTEEFAGTWIALLVALLLFSFAHVQNPNQSLGSVLFLFLSSTLFLAPFILTRRIWLSWGFHAGWNFSQAGLFGMPNSGIDFPGWISVVVDGPLWLTGGAIGLEASWPALAFDVILGLFILHLAYRKGCFVRPQWRRA